MKGMLFVMGRGIGQVMFQNNALSGFLMLAGILLNSWQMALLAIAGNVVSTLAAYFLGYCREDIRNGLYGFNGTLVGMAVGAFMPVTVVSLLLLIAGACLSAWIVRLIGLQRWLSGLTAPFILSVWLLLGACHWMMPSLLLPSGEAVAVRTFSCLQAFCLSFGQVMFQGDTIWAGLLFLSGILINSRINACYAVLGALLSTLFAWLVGVDYAVLNAGLMGYNGVLCAIALGDKTWKGGMSAAVAVLLSVLLQIAGMEWGITTLTAPFVVAVWSVTGLRKWGGKVKTETMNNEILQA